MAFCNKCGTKLVKDAKYCHNCGAKNRLFNEYKMRYHFWDIGLYNRNFKVKTDD